MTTPISSRLIVFTGLLWVLGVSLLADPARALFAPENRLAWCIVPFDAKERSPKARIEMLKKLGIKQYAWDWRQKHLETLREEIAAAKEGGVHLRAVWIWLDAKVDQPGKLSSANQTVFDTFSKAGLAVEYWIGFHGNTFQNLPENERVDRILAFLRPIASQVQKSGGKVLLYNHGDWLGEPANQVRILKALDDPSAGLVYNFHHAHDQVERFPELLRQMLPYLRVVNLNGMRSGGPKILPLGEGEWERKLVAELVAANYQGALGVIGHTEGLDIETVLLQNLRGLEAIRLELERVSSK